MKLKEAKERYFKLKPLENKCKMKTGSIIEKFFIQPSREYLMKNNKSIDLFNAFESDNFYSIDIMSDTDCEIVAICKLDSFMIGKEYDKENFKCLITI